MIGALPFNRCSLAARRAVISAISSTSFLESCSSAASAQSSIQRSRFFITLLYSTTAALFG
jgi:hypothetical protein